MIASALVFAYFSPETFLPVTSLVATVLGLVMMFGRNTVRFIVHYGKRVLRREPQVSAMKQPHFRLQKARDSQTRVAEQSDL